MSAVTLYDLAAGVFVDHKRGPLPEIHAVSWKADTFGARLAACGRLGRFVPAGHGADWAQFPKGDATTAIAPPRCERCLLSPALGQGAAFAHGTS